MRANGIKLVGLDGLGFVLEARYFLCGWTTSPSLLGRDSAVRALVCARSFLPKGFNFKIWDMHRSREVQVRMILSFRDRVSSEHPEWSELQVMREVYRYAAKARRLVKRPDCHRNGGAVDLTIVNSWGMELNMGTDHDDLSARAGFGYFESLKRKSPLDVLIAGNRRLLKRAMEAAGFEGLPREWWHWSTNL